jgi:hypothetical protein
VDREVARVIELTHGAIVQSDLALLVVAVVHEVLKGIDSGWRGERRRAARGENCVVALKQIAAGDAFPVLLVVSTDLREHPGAGGSIPLRPTCPAVVRPLRRRPRCRDSRSCRALHKTGKHERTMHEKTIRMTEYDRGQVQRAIMLPFDVHCAGTRNQFSSAVHRAMYARLSCVCN